MTSCSNDITPNTGLYWELYLSRFAEIIVRTNKLEKCDWERPLLGLGSKTVAE